MGRRDRERRRQERRGAELAPLSDSVPERIVVDEPPPAQARRTSGGTVVQVQHWEGPLPHPSTLRGFEDVVPGSAERIITQFEEQGRHRRKIENRVVWANIIQSAFGQILAFILFMTMVVGGGYLAYQGKELAGLGTIATAVVGGVWVLVQAKRAKQADLADKRQADKAVARRQ